MRPAFAALQVIGWLAGVYCFWMAGRIVRRLRRPYRWSDPRALQPEYHGPEFRSEMRRFFRFLFAGGLIVVALGLVRLLQK